jgi:hypothetical protein
VGPQMPQPTTGNSNRGTPTKAQRQESARRDPELSDTYAILESQKPLPPYELDPDCSTLSFRKRVGDVIARAMQGWKRRGK